MAATSAPWHPPSIWPLSARRQYRSFVPFVEALSTSSPTISQQRTRAFIHARVVITPKQQQIKATFWIIATSQHQPRYQNKLKQTSPRAHHRQAYVAGDNIAAADASDGANCCQKPAFSPPVIIIKEHQIHLKNQLWRVLPILPTCKNRHHSAFSNYLIGGGKRV